MKRTIRAALILAGLAVVGSLLLLADFLNRGVSARRPPGAVEVFVARRLRHLAIPRGARGLKNPEPPSAEVLRDGMAHFADHCASCHGNDGKGRTEVGQGLYPGAPDMTKEDTQALSDGELFYIIKNGVRFTGMPAWGTGTPEDDGDSWKLVRFVRHLPEMTEGELEEMKSLNPTSPSELRERQEIEEFLNGKEGRTKTNAESKSEQHH